MKILVYGINYYPELTGIGKYTGEMCEWLASRGHQVEVITAMPYYPQWQVDSKYKGKWWHIENIKGVKVCRTPLYVPKKVTALSRIIHECSFILNSSIFWFPKFFKTYDVVIAICPPLQTGFFPWLYKTIRRRPFIFHIQDLQVDAAKELGLIKNKKLLQTLQSIEKMFMRNAKSVSIISEGMKKRVALKGIPKEKITLLPNWVDTEFIKPGVRNNSLRKEWGFKDDDKIILYSGNIGDKQGLELMIPVAEKLKINKSIFFVFCGEGSAKNRLITLAEEKNLDNIKFYGLQPYEKLDQLLSVADIHLVLQKRAAADLVFPSKLMSILSAGGLAIVSAAQDTNLYDFVSDHNIGLVVSPENENNIAEIILENISKDHSVIKANAREFALTHLNPNNILAKFELTLSELSRKPV
jgi:colanic acid biosynthesis glycosyl transferase WcaI